MCCAARPRPPWGGGDHHGAGGLLGSLDADWAWGNGPLQASADLSIGPSAITVVTVAVGTAWGIFQPWPVQPVWPPFPTRPTLFVPLPLWAHLPCKEGNEGHARVPAACASRCNLWCMQLDVLGSSNPVPYSLPKPEQFCIIFLLSCLLCKVGVALVSTL